MWLQVAHDSPEELADNPCFMEVVPHAVRLSDAVAQDPIPGRVAMAGAVVNKADPAKVGSAEAGSPDPVAFDGVVVALRLAVGSDSNAPSRALGDVIQTDGDVGS